ncbi:MAG: hypothetical protein PVI26_00590 [Chitinispirillia bacterium]
MRSFTSNFKRDIPIINWKYTWFLSLLITFISITGLELFWRGYGYKPSVIDDKELWSIYRHRVVTTKRRPIVFVGASRMLMGLRTEIFRQHFPENEIIQIAIAATAPVAVLKDLANDERFNGIVIVSMISQFFLKEAFESQKPWVDYYYKKSTVNSRMNRLITRWLQERLVVLNPYLNLRRVLGEIVRLKALPPEQYLITRGDRSRLGDYTKFDFQKQDEPMMPISTKDIIPPFEWLKHALIIEDYIKKILDRGGEVVLIRFPTSGTVLDKEEENYPKQKYWDSYASQSSAKMIHYLDVEGMKDLKCPDGSHLDMIDNITFTNSLIRELKKYFIEFKYL